jgi:hypothetical protein
MRPALVVSTLGIALVGAGAAAHHSSIPWYDLQAEPITVSGVVKDFQFINPHVYIIIDVTRTDGTVEEWKVESTSRNRLLRVGWTADSVKVGQTVTATGFPAWKGRGVDSEKIIVEDTGLVWGR